jgi:hypothetical protein
VWSTRKVAGDGWAREVVFSKEFQKLSGQETRPDGQADGEVKKSNGLFISIAFHPDPTGPVFHKKLFR